MRCGKCGSYVEKGQVTCPACGSVVDVSEPVEQIQSEIGSKIDMFLNDKVDNLRDIQDGVDVENGSMSTGAEYTVVGNIDETDTIFSSESVAAMRANTIQEQARREEKIRREHQEEERRKEEVLREERLRIERLRKERAKEREAYVASQRSPESSGGSNKNKGGKAGIIIAVIAAIIVIAVIVILLVSGLAEETEKKVAEATTEETTATIDEITCNVQDGGEYTVPITVTLESANGYRIYYTLDGKTPSISSNKYLGEITFDESKVEADTATYTLRAVTYTDTSILAGEIKVTFTLRNAAVNAPTISPASGDYTSAQQITISADEGATIYYTYDGTVPNVNSSVYTGPVEMIRGNNVFSALAEKNGNYSTVASAVYNLEIASALSYNDALTKLKTWLKEEKQIDPESTSPSGETAKLSSAGTEIIDGSQYYVITVEVFDSKGQLLATQNYGVDDQDGEIVALEKEGLSYSVIS